MKGKMIALIKSQIKISLLILVVFVAYSCQQNRPVSSSKCWECFDINSITNETIEGEPIECSLTIIFKSTGHALYIINNTDTPYEADYEFIDDELLVIGDLTFYVEKSTDSLLVLRRKSTSPIIPSTTKYYFKPCVKEE